MKVAFICSGLEPGKDGVGDYTRRLAGELIRQGHSCVAIGLSDHAVNSASTEPQEIDGVTVSVFRLPRAMNWNERVEMARTFLGEFRPEWISLQFVPFGFHEKGLAFGLGKRLAAIDDKAAWHIMFHELWLGMDLGAPIKNRVWGRLQKAIIRDMVRRLRPRAVHTQAEPYADVLSREIVPTSVLPLFCNVPFVSGDGWPEVLEPAITAAADQAFDRSTLYLAGVFGSVYDEWRPEEAVETLLPLVRKFDKQLVLVFLGRSSMNTEKLESLRRLLDERAIVVMAGEMEPAEVSKVIQSLDIGLATSPWQAIQKSSTVATLVHHGLPVLVTRDDWRLAGVDPEKLSRSPLLTSAAEFGELTELPSRDQSVTNDDSVRSGATQLLLAFGYAQPRP
jgi:hypothetical protein